MNRMMTGRESLIRLIGKRRRFLPNEKSLLSVPIQSSMDLCEDMSEKVISTQSAEKSREENVDASKAAEDETDALDEKSSSVWVNCPVCGNKVGCGDATINSHLDACLLRSTKRKLTQRTLLQSNFLSLPKVELLSDEPVSVAHKMAVEILDIGTTDGDDTKRLRKHLNLKTVEKTCHYGSGSIENHIDDERSYSKVDSSLSPNNKIADCDVETTIADVSEATLETFIVGRRFSDEKELNIGAAISLLRDPDNVKDPNAIKVISSDSGSSKVLGYLPRELARYLSQLIDKYHLKFEGCITALPKHAAEVVPIQIMCQQTITNGEDEDKDISGIKHLWDEVLQVVESATEYPPTMKKYQQNFNLLLKDVVVGNSHLFTAEEKAFWSFTSLSDDGQRVFVRLYTRKGPWFRLSNISYSEVSSSQQAVIDLVAAGFLFPFEDVNELHDEDIKQILDLLAVSELRDIFSMLKKRINHGSRKQDLIASLLSSYEDGLCAALPSMVLNKTTVCVRISSKAESLVWRAERLFFLNGEQDLSAFMLVDLGIVKYPTYNCIISEHIFSSRGELLAYEEAIEVAQMMDQSLDCDSSDTVLRCILIAESRISRSSVQAIECATSESAISFNSCFTASWVYSKVVLLGISFLECERRYKQAIYLLKRLLNCFIIDGRRGYWTLRLSIDLEHIGCPNESLSVAEDGLLDPWVRAGSKMALQRRILRLGKPPRRWKTPSFSESIKRKIPEVHVQGRALNCKTGTKSRFYGEDGEQCGVEQLALQYYAGEGGGWKGVHTESGIWLTIFGLLMWDILFCDMPNVFRTKFQTAPLDLAMDSFYLTRKNTIESHLQRIYEGMGEEIVITSWESHFKTACRGVNWDRHSLSELRAAVTCIGGPCLAALCRNLAQDYRSWSRGMPDLLLWRFHGDYRGEAKLVEVKSQRDRLSEQQRAWLLLLMDCGFNTEVCKVSPAPTNT